MTIEPCVFIVDDDYAVRDGLVLVIETAGFSCRSFASAEQFLQDYHPDRPGCLILDVNMPGMTGDELQAELTRRKIQLPIIFLTAHGDIPMTVRLIKAGAIDFLTKPVPSKLLLERIRAVLEIEVQKQEQALANEAFCNRLNGLTSRELEILPLILTGQSNKEIARQLGISFRTMEIHRARILYKAGVNNLLELVHLCETCQIPPRSAQ
jgi:two-component system, LuxR family, response regulator FixJ